MANNKKKHRRAQRSMNVFTSCISTTLVLILLGSVVFFVTLARNFSNSIKENFTVSLLLDDDIKKPHINELQKTLNALPCSRQVTFISKERALKEQSEALGTDPSDFIENPIPASFEVHLKAEYANRDSLRHVVPLLKKDKAILDISYPENLMDSLNENIRRISTVMLIIALLLMIVSFELINNTVRLWVHDRRFMIHTMTLVGASWSFIRRPFIVKAFWIGFVSSLFASAILLGGIYMMVEYEPKMLNLLSYEVLGITIGVTFAAGIILTLLCAYISVNKNLKMSYNKLHRY